MIASPLVVRLLVEPLVAVWLVVVVRKLQKKTNITSRKAFLFNLRHRRWTEVTVFTLSVCYLAKRRAFCKICFLVEMFVYLYSCILVYFLVFSQGAASGLVVTMEGSHSVTQSWDITLASAITLVWPAPWLLNLVCMLGMVTPRTSYGHPKNPIDFGVQRSKVKVTGVNFTSS